MSGYLTAFQGATGCCGCTVFRPLIVVSEFDDIGETGEGSAGRRRGETAVDSDALTEGVCSLMFFLLRDIEYLSPIGLGQPLARELEANT